MSARLGRPVDPKRGGEYLRRVGARPLVPRPRHVNADAQARFHQNLGVRRRAVRPHRPLPSRR